MQSAVARFEREYKPDHKAIVELKNGRFVDVKHERFFNSGVRLLIQGTTIVAMPGLEGETVNMTPDYTIDLHGKTAMPGLFNTHCHVSMAGPTLAFTNLKDIRLGKRYSEEQITKNMLECLAHGVTNIRDAWSEDLRDIQYVKDCIASKKILGPRILQSVAVGPTGSYLAAMYYFMPRLMFGLFGIPNVDHSDKEAGIVEFPVDAKDSQVRDAVDRAVDERNAQAIKIGEERKHIATHKPLTIMTIKQLRALVNQAKKRGLQVFNALLFYRFVPAGN